MRNRVSPASPRCPAPLVMVAKVSWRAGLGASDAAQSRKAHDAHSSPVAIIGPPAWNTCTAFCRDHGESDAAPNRTLAIFVELGRKSPRLGERTAQRFDSCSAFPRRPQVTLTRSLQGRHARDARDQSTRTVSENIDSSSGIPI